MKKTKLIRVKHIFSGLIFKFPWKVVNGVWCYLDGNPIPPEHLKKWKIL